MSRTMLLCFIHGFKGDDDTFKAFPQDLKTLVSANLPKHRVESVVYPQYETKGELGQCSAQFLEWLKERVMEIRKAHLEKPWPPNDRSVGVILVAHSMGGFVAADSLFLVLKERAASQQDAATMFPLLQGILAFDTPYNGLARSMFVYGAFSNYSKVSSVFNVMSAVAAAPAGLGRLAFKRGVASVPSATRSSSHPGWKAWQLIAVRTGTVGAIAAGGVAAYVHRQKIAEGVRSVRNFNRESLVEGYHQGVGAIGQGLAYVNRGNVGKSFAWLADHFIFVGALMKQDELNQRLERMAALRGIGVHDFYTSLGENGYWTGGYFVPERTFCAVPPPDQPAGAIFSRHVIENVADEVDAHMSVFKPEKHAEYEQMTQEASEMVVRWFTDDSEVFDDPKIATAPSPAESEEEEQVKVTDDGVDASTLERMSSGYTGVAGAAAAGGKAAEGSDDNYGLPDESPIDIAAAASLVPLPDDDGEDVAPEERERRTYMRHLFEVAEQAGTGLRTMWPAKMPSVDSMSIPKVPMPNMIPPMPNMPTMPTMPVMPSMSGMPGAGLFSKKQESSAGKGASGERTVVDGGGDSAEDDNGMVGNQRVEVEAEVEMAGKGAGGTEQGLILEKSG